MNDKAIADLRTESLAAALKAARRRRIGRRSRAAAGAITALAAIAMFALVSTKPQPVPVSTSSVVHSPPGVTIARTEFGTVTRITTARQPSSLQIHTTPSTYVKRINDAELAALVPDKEIILIGM